MGDTYKINAKKLVTQANNAIHRTTCDRRDGLISQSKHDREIKEAALIIGTAMSIVSDYPIA